jgi:di/tricarboxylate transporter
MRMSAAFTINFHPMPVAYLILLVSFLIFFASYLVFAIGRFPGTRIDRPAMAVIGGALMFAFGVLTPEQGIKSIDFSTLVLLFSMMLIVSSLHLAGFFTWITALAAERLKAGMLLPAIIFTSGVLSAILVNDVVCLAMAPLVLRLCRRMGQRPALYLLALATSSNIGSVATITGNPQNILIGSLSKIGYNQFLARLGPVAVMGDSRLVPSAHRVRGRAGRLFGGDRAPAVPLAVCAGDGDRAGADRISTRLSTRAGRFGWGGDSADAPQRRSPEDLRQH